MADVLFDFDNQGDATRSLKRVAQAMLRAGQPVVSHDFDPKLRRTSGVGYRHALLPLASGQTVTLMVKQTGDVYRVLLNGAVLPIKNQDGIKAIGEIAAAAERNQKKFQAAQARIKAQLPKGIRTAAPKMAEALAQRNTELDALISEKTAERDGLKAELGPEAALDSVEQPRGFPKKWHDGKTYNRDQFTLEPTDEHGELPPGWVLKPDAVPVDVLDSVELKPWTEEHAAALQLAASIEAGTALDAVGDLSAAMATLQIALDTVENNAPINEAAGKVEQANLERESAESFRKALAILDDATGSVLSSAALEVLAQVAKGPVEDGDVASKSGRNELIEAGYIDRYTDDGDNVINEAGRTFLADIDDEEYEPAAGQEPLFGEEDAA